jgi:hypothetical protein
MSKFDYNKLEAEDIDKVPRDRTTKAELREQINRLQQDRRRLREQNRRLRKALTDNDASLYYRRQLRDAGHNNLAMKMALRLMADGYPREALELTERTDNLMRRRLVANGGLARVCVEVTGRLVDDLKNREPDFERLDENRRRFEARLTEAQTEGNSR